MPAKSPPQGYHTITPSLVVRGGAQAIEFYKRAFGAQEIDRMTGPDGSIMHAEIQIGDSHVMLGEESKEWGALSPQSTNGSPVTLHIYVENADTTFAQAVRAGAKVKQPLEDAFWGDRYGKLTDPFGHEWSVATRVKDMSQEEMRRAGEEWMSQHAHPPQPAQA